MLRLSLVLVLAVGAGGCTAIGGERTIVASVYPLAFAADQLAGPGWEVIDLTPPGSEAHDLELSLQDRAAIEGADLVLYLGQLGFQPQVEAAVAEARGTVVDYRGEVEALAGNDPHVWLEPNTFSTIARDIAGELCPITDPCEAEEAAGRDRFIQRIHELGGAYFEGLSRCDLSTMLVSHEAFGHLAAFHGLRQFGLTGLVPEAEPSAARLQRARALIDSGEAGAIFYEEGGEARQLAETFAADAGVPALPLSTLESRPAEGDYFSVMERNLQSLREGLQCR